MLDVHEKTLSACVCGIVTVSVPSENVPSSLGSTLKSVHVWAEPWRSTQRFPPFDAPDRRTGSTCVAPASAAVASAAAAPIVIPASKRGWCTPLLLFPVISGA